VVRLTEVTVGPLPTLPLLAGLPNGPMGAVGALLLAVPVLAGLAAGWMLTLRVVREAEQVPPPEVRRRPGSSRPAARPKPFEAPWSVLIGGGLIAGPAAGVVLGVLAHLSGGSLGDGRLATIGPDAWQVGLVATAVVGVSAAIGAAAARRFKKPA
jgi:hypothetical protein